MKQILALACIAAITACAPKPPEISDPLAGAPASRNRSVPISATLRGTPADIAGEWRIGQTLAAGGFGAKNGKVLIEPMEDGGYRWTVPKDDHLIAFETDLVGPSQYRMRSLAPRPLELWVMWVDDDFRTAVIGTPDGRFGWIMDRPGAASGDRTRAGREILDFNGYDIAQFGD